MTRADDLARLVIGCDPRFPAPAWSDDKLKAHLAQECDHSSCVYHEVERVWGTLGSVGRTESELALAIRVFGDVIVPRLNREIAAMAVVDAFIELFNDRSVTGADIIDHIRGSIEALKLGRFNLPEGTS